MQLIDKDALVAEIENWKQYTLKCGYAGQGEYEEGNKQGRLDTCEKILSSLDTLEVKEVDCEREIGIYTTKELLKKRNHSTGVFHLTQTDINSIAKHFFELGLKTKEK